jgi:hypothetical protein
MVLKCLFLGLDITLVESLEGRLNPALSRMCYDYLRERSAAGRTIPVSIWLAIRIVDLPEAAAAFREHLHDDDPAHRANVRRAVAQQARALGDTPSSPELAALRALIEDAEGSPG